MFFHQHLGLERGTLVVCALVRNAQFYGLDAFISCRWIEVQAIAASMQVGATALALVGNLNLIRDLHLRSAVIAARDQMKARFDAPTRSSLPWRRFWPLLAVFILVTALTILSGHLSPQRKR